MTAALHRLLARVGALFTGRQLDRDLDDEVALHIQLRAEALERVGLSRDAAVRTARMEFNGITQLREAHRTERGVPRSRSSSATCGWRSARCGAMPASPPLRCW